MFGQDGIGARPGLRTTSTCAGARAEVRPFGPNAIDRALACVADPFFCDSALRRCGHMRKHATLDVTSLHASTATVGAFAPCLEGVIAIWAGVIVARFQHLELRAAFATSRRLLCNSSAFGTHTSSAYAGAWAPCTEVGHFAVVWARMHGTCLYFTFRRACGATVLRRNLHRSRPGFGTDATSPCATAPLGGVGHDTVYWAKSVRVAVGNFREVRALSTT